ncbi:MAG: ribonuclease P protein component [Bacilli bacterium]|nr:ribonuclease P protein component [Bacilli bacterium]
MKKKQIIKSKLEFTQIINNCPFIKNNYFIIYYSKKEKNNKYGISVPKKTGKAYLRNKIKRQVKNIIDNNEFILPKSYDYVIIIRKRLIELKYNDMEKQFINAIKKIGEKNE